MPELSRTLGKTLLNHGACLVGYADLSALPPKSRKGLPVGVSIAVPIKAGIVTQMHRGPDAKYRREYDRLNRLLDRLVKKAASILKKAGWKAVPKAATHSEIDWKTLTTPLPHKTVATLSGLGWVGKCALLVTREFGTSIRLASVLTDAPLVTGKPVRKSLCGTCRECGKACPGGAVSGALWEQGRARSKFFNVHACHEITKANEKSLGDLICGICIAVCPWTKKRLRKKARSSKK